LLFTRPPLPPPFSALCPYTTLFRSARSQGPFGQDAFEPPLCDVFVAHVVGQHADADTAQDGEAQRHQVIHDAGGAAGRLVPRALDRKSTRLNSSHVKSSYAVS